MPSLKHRIGETEIATFDDSIDEMSSSGKSIPTSSSSISCAFQSMPQDALDSMKPMLVLLQAQECKKYYEWIFDTMSDIVWQITSSERPKEFLLAQRLSLVGTDVIVQGEGLESFKVSLINENGSSSVEMSGEILSINCGQLILACTDLASLKNLEKLCLLAIFEYSSVLKSITGTIISTLGLRMSDMAVILNSAFNYKDWCDVYLKGEGWVKLWCHIDKVNRKSSSDHRNGHCQIKFYRDKKSTSSKNLVCFIPDCEYVQDMFFYKNYSMESRDSQTGITELLDNLSMIKVVGNVCFPQDGFSKRNRSRSSSSMSFFHNNDNSSSRPSSVATSPTSSTSRLRMLSPKKKHQRNTSEISVDSTHSNYKDLDNCITDPQGLLIRPLAHNGVHHLEAMIRFIIPMMDCVGLYGRPAHFKTERTDPASLMFGLPKLPLVDYFAKEELQLLFKQCITIEKPPSTDFYAIAMHFYSKFLKERMIQNPKREQKLAFRELGNLPKVEDLFSFSKNLGPTNSTDSSPII